MGKIEYPQESKAMMRINSSIQIDKDEIQVSFIKASGPGGQNVNKVATAVQLRFDVRNSPSLPDEVKARLIKQAGKRMTSDGILVIEAKRYRAQEQNKEDAIGRLVTLIQKAAEKPKKRVHTKPPRSSQEKRLMSKKKRGELKNLRSKQVKE